MIGGGMGQPTEQQKVAIIRQQMQAMSDALYVRAAVEMMKATQESDGEGVWPTGADYAVLAQQCQMAAQAYFVGIGLIQLEQPASDSDPTLKDQTGQ